MCVHACMHACPHMRVCVRMWVLVCIDRVPARPQGESLGQCDCLLVVRGIIFAFVGSFVNNYVECVLRAHTCCVRYLGNLLFRCKHVCLYVFPLL